MGKIEIHKQRVKAEKKMAYVDANKYMQETNSWQMAGAKPLFVSAAAKKMESCAVQTDIKGLKGDNPALPKDSPVKETQTARQQWVTPQQMQTTSHPPPPLLHPPSKKQNFPGQAWKKLDK